MKENSDIPVCFISDHEGFHGTIKNYTRDFVVIEVNLDGQRVYNPASIAGDPQASAQDSQCPLYKKTHKGYKQERVPISKVADTSDDRKNGDVTFLSTLNLDLNVVLGQFVYEELEQFVVYLKYPPDETEGTSQANKELSLGSFPDKHQRANVHRAVRQHFPFLMTVTNQSEIKVREDPDYKELFGLVTEQEAEDFFRFLDAKVPGSSYTFRPDGAKEHRAAVHHLLSRRFGKLVETKSFGDQGHTSITVRLRERVKRKKRNAEDCVDGDVYTAFVLYKDNLETLEAISYMAATLGVLPSDFTYAGVKDKRAITYQAMVVKKVSAQRLTEKMGEFDKRGLRLSQVRPAREPLRLGQLQGNHFDLVVRNLRPHGNDPTPRTSTPDTPSRVAAAVRQAVDNVKARGFVNYYGPQRFGVGQIVQSDRVGLALLKGDMVSAVRLFFTPEEGNEPENQAKRHFLQTGNAKESLALMPVSKARERLMLRALNRYGTGPDGCARAWLGLPHAMRAFYPHAYCSRVWNEAVAHRLTTLGHRASLGDLVRTKDPQDPLESTEESCMPRIHVVTADEEREEVYTLEQVLLPMPGNTVKYPENALGAWYEDRLLRDGLHNCRFRIGPLKLNLPGCYRPLLAFPRHLSYQLQGAGGIEGEPPHEGEPDVDSLSLALSFDLSTSCYATVCLREVMKMDF